MAARILPNELIVQILGVADRQTRLVCERTSKDIKETLTCGGKNSPWYVACKRDFADDKMNALTSGLKKPSFKYVYFQLEFKQKKNAIVERFEELYNHVHRDYYFFYPFVTDDQTHAYRQKLAQIEDEELREKWLLDLQSREMLEKPLDNE